MDTVEREDIGYHTPITGLMGPENIDPVSSQSWSIGDRDNCNERVPDQNPRQFDAALNKMQAKMSQLENTFHAVTNDLKISIERLSRQNNGQRRNRSNSAYNNN